jgi:protein-L-isoaspartate(D-aspartate) O-methyltransferase
MMAQWLTRMKSMMKDKRMSGGDPPHNTPSDAPWLHGWPEIYDDRVRAAFARVPRAAFVGMDMQEWATFDTALPIDEGQTISQPFVVALMTQALELRPGDRVLEIGTGSGYQTAILCELTTAYDWERDEGRGHSVWSVERYERLAQQAARALYHLDYHPHLSIGDGAAGWPVAAPFDAVIVSAAAPALPRPLWNQLAEGGRLVIPVGPPDKGQLLWLVVKHGHRLMRRSLGGVRFVPFVSPILDDPAQRIELN